MTRSYRPRAFTFFEVVVAATVMLLVTGAALLLLGNTNRSVGDQLAITDTSNRANRLAESLRRELRSAGGEITLSDDTVTTSGGYTRIAYNKMTGFDWSSGGPAFDESVEPQRQIRFEPTESSTTNGVDDDGDGLVDEGRLVLYFDRDDSGTFTADEETAVIATDVAGDTLAFSIQPSGATTRQDDDTHLVVNFETFRRLPNDTRIIIHREQVELQLALRNREQN